ncbi:MAG: ATP-binding cassette domain-containing protein [Candidatus Kapabacteria bacterium]|nr:ATP-binding cassette domain-containing protein [Candidatus Kapabacteria bacterium]
MSKHHDFWRSLRAMIIKEKRDVAIVTIYSIVSSVLGLVVPLSSQAIVNAVALGVFSQQLVVLCVLVALSMIALAVISVFERYVVDMIQRRLFVETVFDIVSKLPRFTQGALRKTYGPELVNRFFDVVTVQKSFGKFLLEGINAILVLLTGLIVLGFYHPFFLLYDVAFMLFIPILVFVLGRGAISTAIKASKQKYFTASLLEDVARNQLAIKLTGTHRYGLERMNSVTTDYVHARHKHYVILARQIFGSYLFKGLATVGILALGGILVIEQAISLGQLVAAEIIIILILGAMEKLISQFDLYYDLIAALDKLAEIVDQPEEESGSIVVPHRASGGTIDIRNVHFAYDDNIVLKGVNLSVSSGQKVSLVGASGMGKTTLAQLLLGLDSPTKGSLEVNGVDTRVADLRSLRSRVGYVFPDNQIIPGTVLDNITLGRSIPLEDLNWAIHMSHLDVLIRDMSAGLNTMVYTTGENLSFGMRRRILFARMIVDKPEILIIDEAFEGIEDSAKLKILDGLMSWPNWTIVNISHDPELVRRTSHVYVLDDGIVVESGRPLDLHARGGVFTSLFPDSEYFAHRDQGGMNG